MSVGNHRLARGKRVRVWSCEGHREGVEEATELGNLEAANGTRYVRRAAYRKTNTGRR